MSIELRLVRGNGQRLVARRPSNKNAGTCPFNPSISCTSSLAAQLDALETHDPDAIQVIREFVAKLLERASLRRGR